MPSTATFAPAGCPASASTTPATPPPPSRWRSISMTVDTYRHVLPQLQEEAGPFLTHLILTTDEGEAR